MALGPLSAPPGPYLRQSAGTSSLSDFKSGNFALFSVVVMSTSAFADAIRSRPGVVQVLKRPFEMQHSWAASGEARTTSSDTGWGTTRGFSWVLGPAAFAAATPASRRPSRTAVGAPFAGDHSS